MKALSNYICFVFALTIFLGCKPKTKKNHNDDLSKKEETLILPDSLVLYHLFSANNLASKPLENGEFKIYSFIDVSCPSCLSNIKRWKNFESQISQYKVPILLICQSEDNYELLKYLCEKKEIPEISFPFYFDVKDQFFVRNKFLSPSPNNHTVLTNKYNKILLSGDPTLSSKINKLYIDAIKANKI